MRLAILFTALTALSTGAASTGEPPRGESVRGITLSTHGNGRDWGSDLAVKTLDDIKQVGAGWVSIHPYAGIRADGALHFHEFNPASPPDYIAKPIAEAHARGLKILIKPHVAYWGSPFSWRGEIEFADTDQRARFWRDYRRWIVMLAEGSKNADGFAVGTELDRMLGDEQLWRDLIRDVRAKTRAPLTYAANWTDYERVGFWDALDAIGIQAYFPLSEDDNPTEATIRKAWERWMGTLRATAARHNRVVVFTELGYNQSFNAAARPWESATDGEEARALQEICLRVALEAIESEPAVVGAFLWKWFPRPFSVGRNFQLATPEMKRVIREIWTGP